MKPYAIWCAAAIAAFAVMEWRGVSLVPTPDRTTVPASARSTPGGFRSYHWRTTSRGGK